MLHRFMQKILEILKQEEGATAVEYAVMLALIVVACILSITSLGTNSNKSFTRVSNVLSAGS